MGNSYNRSAKGSSSRSNSLSLKMKQWIYISNDGSLLLHMITTFQLSQNKKVKLKSTQERIISYYFNFIHSISVLLYLLSLRTGPGRLLTSSLALVLWYGTGPSSNFLAKILRVNTPHCFSQQTNFIFHINSLTL
jgi:hypothetical protein